MGAIASPEGRQGSEPVCPACGDRIQPGVAVGGRPGRLLHLDCYLGERAQLSSTEEG
jgi:hypothetical protein